LGIHSHTQQSSRLAGWQGFLQYPNPIAGRKFLVDNESRHVTLAGNRATSIFNNFLAMLSIGVSNFHAVLGHLSG